MHLEGVGSAGLHLFKELSALGSAVPARAFAPLGSGRSKVHVSSAPASTAPALRRCAFPYRHALPFVVPGLVVGELHIEIKQLVGFVSQESLAPSPQIDVDGWRDIFALAPSL